MSRKAGHGKQSESEQIMNQVWHGLVDTLRLLPTVPSKSAESVTSESQTVEDALDKINLLISLRKGEAVAPERLSLPVNPSISISAAAATPGTPSSSVGGGGGNKRKRRPSVSISPAPPSPAPAQGSGRIDRSATPSLLNLNAKGKKDKDKEDYAYDARQLPLRPGRKVAFKQPPPKGQPDDDGDIILVTVKRSILQDRTRYEVQDDDDGQVYNTTLRSIIPLPDPEASPSHPSHPSHYEDFPRGATVLALYPDTTSFYQATVVVPAKKGKYRLAFVDDGDTVHEVDATKVLKWPFSA